MRIESIKRWISLVLSFVIVLVCLSGCGSEQKQVASTPTDVEQQSVPDVSIAPAKEEAVSVTVEPETTGAIDMLSAEQKNSLNMLNYLAFITQEILTKKNSRVYIEQVYSSLMNDINPSTVNDLTEAHYDDLLDRLHEFEKLLTKRERLQYLFEQNQAQAMRSAIPNPLGLLSAVKSMNIASLVASVAYMAVDAVSSYASGMSAAEQTFLQNTWELDDEESDTIHSLRTQAFMYMVEVVKGYTLPDKLTLTEKKVDKLVEWNEKSAEDDSPASRVHFYKTYEEDYEGFGLYWLARATAHFDNKEYAECLKCIQRYEDLNIGIYRQDYELAKVLPVAIGAASQIYDDKTYVDVAGKYANLIIENTDIKNNWALRYFVAQTYIDICARTQDKSYLREAYTIALENANELKSEQKKLNSEYIADFKPEVIPQGTADAKKKEIEAYNKQKQQERETELPPIYEPLKLNLDLLYALADQLEITDAEKAEMEDILYVDGKSLFISIPMDELYRKPENYDYPKITYTGKDIVVPVDHLTPDTKIEVIMHEGTGPVPIRDWKITKVERKVKNDVASYVATFHSKKAETYDYKKAKDLVVNIQSIGSTNNEVYTFKYKVKNSKEWLFIDKAEFEEIK